MVASPQDLRVDTWVQHAALLATASLAALAPGRIALHVAWGVVGAQVADPCRTSAVAEAATQRRRITSMLVSEEISADPGETSLASFASGAFSCLFPFFSGCCLDPPPRCHTTAKLALRCGKADGHKHSRSTAAQPWDEGAPPQRCQSSAQQCHQPPFLRRRRHHHLRRRQLRQQPHQVPLTPSIALSTPRTPGLQTRRRGVAVFTIVDAHRLRRRQCQSFSPRSRFSHQCRPRCRQGQQIHTIAMMDLQIGLQAGLSLKRSGAAEFMGRVARIRAAL